MTLIQAIIIAAIQGVTELFPVSSLGHAVVLPKLLGWNLDQDSPSFLPFLVMLHVGTLIALLLYFWRDWVGIVAALFGKGSRESVREGRRLLGLLIAGTIPAVILGYVLNKPLHALFNAPMLVAGMLIVNGVILLIAERLRRRAGSAELNTLSYAQAVVIGTFQAGALIPGLSRSGLTMGAGLRCGLSHAQSARFTFLLAAPIIAGAAVLEIPKMLHAGAGVTHDIAMSTAVLGGVISGVFAWLSVAALMRFFKKQEFESMRIFAWYCMIFGVIALALLALR